jgi:hypothetical protein
MSSRKNILSRYLLICAPAAIAVFTVLHFASEIDPEKSNAPGSGETDLAVVRPSSFEHPAFVPERAPAAVISNSAEALVSEPCHPLEVVGRGPASVSLSDPEWDWVLDQFHASKTRLLSWFTNHRGSFSEPLAAKMEEQLRNLRIARPSPSSEPDLAWRGIGVFEPGETEGLIKIGAGFLSLLKQNPERGKFELTRLVAQVWAPCELRKIKSQAGDPWQSALECLGVKESQACASGRNSEGGWAISTAIAYQVSAPGCIVPAFEQSSPASCFDSARVAVQ